MNLALPSDPLSLQAGAAWARLLEAAQAVGRALRGSSKLTPAQEHLYKMTEELGATILDAEDVADLRSRLYTVASGLRLLQWEVAVFREMDFRDIPSADDVEATFVESLGPTHLARECARLFAVRMELLGRLFEDAEEVELSDDFAEALRSALADFRTPPVIRSLFGETLAGEAALLAFTAPLIDPERWQCPPWMRLALLEQVRLACISHLRLLSLAPGLDIPEDVLPLDERLDPKALEAESRELARQLLPAELHVGPAYLERLREEIEGASPAPPGVRSLFLD